MGRKPAKKEPWTKEESFADAKRVRKILGKSTVLAPCEYCGFYCVVRDRVKMHPECAHDPKRLRPLKKAPNPDQELLL